MKLLLIVVVLGYALGLWIFRLGEQEMEHWKRIVREERERRANASPNGSKPDEPN